MLSYEQVYLPKTTFNLKCDYLFRMKLCSFVYNAVFISVCLINKFSSVVSLDPVQNQGERVTRRAYQASQPATAPRSVLPSTHGKFGPILWNAENQTYFIEMKVKTRCISRFIILSNLGTQLSTNYALSTL